MDIIYNIRTEIYPYYTTFNQLLLFISVSFCPCYFLTVTSYPVTFYPTIGALCNAGWRPRNKTKFSFLNAMIPSNHGLRVKAAPWDGTFSILSI